MCEQILVESNIKTNEDNPSQSVPLAVVNTPAANLMRQTPDAKAKDHMATEVSTGRRERFCTEAMAAPRGDGASWLEAAVLCEWWKGCINACDNENELLPTQKKDQLKAEFVNENNSHTRAHT